MSHIQNYVVQHQRIPSLVLRILSIKGIGDVYRLHCVDYDFSTISSDERQAMYQLLESLTEEFDLYGNLNHLQNSNKWKEDKWKNFYN